MNSALRPQRFAIDGLGALACLLIVTGAYFLGLRPLMRQQMEAVTRRQQLGAQRQKAAAAQSSVRQLKAQLMALRAIAAQAVLQAEPLTRTNVRLREITSLAAARGLAIKGVQPGPIRQEPQFQSVPLRLTGSGSYRGCVQFLHDIRSALPDTTVNGFSMSGTPETAASTATFDLDLCWYAAPALASAQEK